MSKALLYAVNTNSQTLAVNGIVSFGNVVRRYGNNIDITNGNPTVCGSGYYGIDTNITVASSGTGTMVISLYKDGVLIPGATQRATIETSGDIASFSIPAVVRQNCCVQSTITAVLTGVAGSVTNAAIIVEKA